MSVAAPEPKRNMGQPVPRVDARLKVTGQARFAADFPIGNLAHGVLATVPAVEVTLHAHRRQGE